MSMIPIWDSPANHKHKPVLTWLFLIINIGVFLYESSLSPEMLNTFIMQYGAVPSILAKGQNIISLFTSMFLHGWWMHLIGNMLFLYVFWDNIEGRLGSVKFLIFYIIWWLAAHAWQILVMGLNSDIPSIWASWCIAAVLGAYLVLFPDSQIRMLNPYNMSVYSVWAGQFLMYWIILQLFSWTWSLFSAWEWGWVAYRAHIGWFVFGRLLGKTMRGEVGEVV